MDSIMSLDVLYTPVSWALLRWHDLLAQLGISAASGLNWSLSIVLLVVSVRLLLVGFAVRAARQQRHVALLQPRLDAIKRQFRHDRAEQQRQILALQRAEGVNPMAGCLTIVVQLPIFIALYHVLRHVANSAGPARLLGAPLGGRLADSAAHLNLLGGSVGAVWLVGVTVVVISAGATLATQTLARRAGPPAVGPAATVQRIMLVGAPAGALVSGVLFPLGVVLYWCTSNVWTLGQQVWLRRHIAPVVASTPPATSPPRPSRAPRVGQRPKRRRSPD
jgi:YidC/Oxa1 family membrane protein insertase